MPSPQSPLHAKSLLTQLTAAGLDAPVLEPTDARWDRLQSSCPSGIDLRDRFRGVLIGGAIGDAMGRTVEGRSPEEARRRKIREYQPWPGWTGGPKGTITDDTQMTMWLAESILGRAAEPQRAEIKKTEVGGQRSEIGRTEIRGQRSEEQKSEVRRQRSELGDGGEREAGRCFPR
jgi:hypothetical protein